MGVYLLSTCEKVIVKKSKYLAYFHFKGVYKGLKISSIKLESETALNVKMDYLLFIEVTEVKSEVLYGRVLRSKMID